MKKRLPLTIVLISQLLAGGFAQQPAPSPTPALPTQERPPQPESDDVVRITTNLVQVDAVITDKDGKLVTDLKREEVGIYEDGREQDITNFSFNLSEAPTPAGGVKPAAVPRDAPAVPPSRVRPEDIRRTIALVVDDLGLSFESTHYVRRALKKFVDEQMQPGDLVAIVRTGGGMGALQQFTTDKRQLYAAVERVKWTGLGRSQGGAFASIEPAAVEEAEPRDVPKPGETAEQLREEVYTVGTLGALGYVVRGLRELPGRKSVMLVSDGLSIFNREDPARSTRVIRALQNLIDQANRASVVIYTMDARGLPWLGLSAADSVGDMGAEEIRERLDDRRAVFFEGQNGLNYLAHQTGGLAIRNSNDLSAGIRRVLDDQSGYYLIGYRPDQSTFNPRTGRRQFHRLSLKIKRPGKFNVRMRQGFFGITDDEERSKPRTLGQQLLHALLSPFGATGVHLRLTSLFAHDAKAGSFMRSLLHIDANDLTFTKEADGVYKTMIDIVAITFGDNGVAIEQLGKTYQMRVSESEHKRILREGLVYYVTVPIKKPGAYQLRMSLRDSASERIGSASQFIEAPDIKKKRLALSGLIVREQTRVPGGALASTAGEGREEGSAQTSAAVRQFKPSTIIAYAYFIFNPKPDKASARPQVITQVKLFRDGKEIFSGKETPYDSSGQTDLQRLPVGGALQLSSNMEPGDYVLQVIVTDQLADKKHRVATQWMDFQIVK